MSCGLITSGGQNDCDEFAQGGTRARLIVLNYSDVLFIYENSEGIITSIVLKPGASGYEFLGFRDDMKKSDEVVKGGKTRFRHNLGFVIYEIDQLQKNNIKKFAKGRFLAIIENKGETANSIEVLGKNVGLSIVAGLVRDAYAGNVYTISLSTPEGIELERKLPQTLGNSYTAGQNIIDELLGEEEAVTFDTTLLTWDSTLYTFDNQ